MNITIYTESLKDQRDYEARALHPLQSWAWGEARKKMGIEVIRFGNGENVFQMTVHPVPHSGFRIGYIPRSLLPDSKTLKFLKKTGKEKNLIFIKFEPYVLKTSPVAKIVATDDENPLVHSGHPLFPDWTQVLDLNVGEEELLKKMHHKTRYNIRLAQKKGVTVKEMSSREGFEIFSRLYFETCRRQKYHGHNLSYHQTVWDTLSKSMSRIMIAFYEGVPLAAYELFIYKNIIYYVYGGTSDLFRNVMAANLLMWESIKLGRKEGAEKFDMWGSLPPGYDPAHPWSGFTRFKEGYGTRFVEMAGSFDLVINPFMYTVYNAIYSLRSLYLKLTG